MRDDVEANIALALEQGARQGGADFAQMRYASSPWAGRADPTLQAMLDRGLVELVSRVMEGGTIEVSIWRWTEQGRAALAQPAEAA